MTLHGAPKRAEECGHPPTQEEIDAWYTMQGIVKVHCREGRIDRRTVIGITVDISDKGMSLEIRFRASNGAVVRAIMDTSSYLQTVKYTILDDDGHPLVVNDGVLTAMQLLEMSAGLDPLELWYNAVRNQQASSAKDTAKKAP